MSGPILAQAASGSGTPSTSDPLKTFVDNAIAAGKAGEKSGESAANEVLNAIGIKPEPAAPPEEKKNDLGIVLLVIGGLFLVGAAALVVYVVRRARK